MNCIKYKQSLRSSDLKVSSTKYSKYFLKIILALLIFATYYLLPTTLFAQGFNVASMYDVEDKDAQSGDIIVSAGLNGLKRTNVTYDSKLFGVLNDTPLLVLREATGSANLRPIIRAGDVDVNVVDLNGEIKKGDYVTTSSVLGKGMRAGQSGYALGIALNNATYSDKVVRADSNNGPGTPTKLGTVKVAVMIEYAELTTARNSFRLLNDLNAAFFRNIQNPEKFTLTIRYIIAGLITIIAFTIGFFTVSRSIAKAVEAIGRNPLARTSIMSSVIFQVIATAIGALATIGIVYMVIRL